MTHTQKKFLTISGLILLVILLLVPSIYFFLQYQKTKEELKISQSLTKGDVSSLIERVGKLVELPKGEVPTVAMIADVNQLKGQAFFAKAQNGDQVLVYKGAKQAFLYDPVNNRIREVGPVTLENSSLPQDTSAPSQFASLSLALVNATSQEAVTPQAEAKIKSNDLNVSIVGRAFAKNAPYAKTFIVDLTGTKGNQLSALAKIFNASFESLPKDEEALKTAFNGADAALFLGEDFVSTPSAKEL